MRQKKKAIVLFSGGLDSTVCLWWAKKKGYSCSALSYDYGQRHKKELDVAKRLARRANVPHEIVKFTLPWGGSSLTNKKSKLPTHSLSNISSAGIPSTYVPGRNTIFLSFGLSWADQQKAGTIVIGANAIDYSGYPDCRPNFMRAFEKVANEGTRMGTEGKRKIKIEVPLLRMTKKEIVALGRQLNAPIDLTWSCYAGNKAPCGKCDSCLLRNKGFSE